MFIAHKSKVLPQLGDFRCARPSANMRRDKISHSGKPLTLIYISFSKTEMLCSKVYTIFK